MANDKLNWKTILDWRKLICILALAALWAVPISRAASFIRYARGVDGQEQTLNSSNDVHYGVALLVLYSLCLVMDFALCFLLARKSLVILLLLLSAPIWVVIKIIQYKP